MWEGYLQACWVAELSWKLGLIVVGSSFECFSCEKMAMLGSSSESPVKRNWKHEAAGLAGSNGSCGMFLVFKPRNTQTDVRINTDFVVDEGVWQVFLPDIFIHYAPPCLGDVADFRPKQN